MRGVSCLTALLLIAFFSTSSRATTIHVPADSSTIQGGISGAVDGDTVLVAPGTYHEHDIDFLGKAIVVTGTDPEDSAVVAATVVDGDSLGSVFFFHTGEDTTSVLAGLTITGGHSEHGGGIYCEHSSPIIRNSAIVANSATDQGGGIRCYDHSSPAIIGCKITRNKAYQGAGILCHLYSSPIIRNCIVSENSTTGWRGGGIHLNDWSDASIQNCIISGNVSVHQGGGININYA